MTIKHANTLFVLLLLLLSFSLLLYPQVITDWRTYSFDDGTYSHAFLMPFIIATLLWQQRNTVTVRFNAGYLFAMVALALILAICITAQQISVTRLLFPLYVILLFCSLTKPTVSIIVPLSLLWFIAPVWGSLTEPLQAVAVMITTFFMQLTAIPVYVDGNFIQIPQGVFEVAEGCSGLRYFIVSVALSTLLCHLQLRRLRNIVLITFCAIVGAMLVNGIRIVLIIMIGYYSDMQSSIVHDHNMFGWFLYIPFIALLFYLAGKLEPHYKTETQPYIPQRFLYPSTLLVILTAILLSGSGLKLLLGQYPLFDYNAIALAEPDNPVSPAATIAAYSRITQHIVSIDGVNVLQIHYDFDGRHDANRADYYLNDVIPTGWRQTDKEITAHSQLIWLSDRSDNHAIVQYWYQANGENTGSVSVYKINRIKQALSLDASSALGWQFVRCQHRLCAAEARVLRQINNNRTPYE
jgi:exosortase